MRQHISGKIGPFPFRNDHAILFSLDMPFDYASLIVDQGDALSTSPSRLGTQVVFDTPSSGFRLRRAAHRASLNAWILNQSSRRIVLLSTIINQFVACGPQRKSDPVFGWGERTPPGCATTPVSTQGTGVVRDRQLDGAGITASCTEGPCGLA